jgi:hypothetical protein
MTPTTRQEAPADHEAVRHVNRLAFGRGGEAGIADALRSGGYSRVSPAAEVEGRVVGHVLLSDLPVLTDGGTVPALSLAPMAVLPEAWPRTAVHGQSGPLTLRQPVLQAVRHLRHHLPLIAEERAALGTGGPSA